MSNLNTSNSNSNSAFLADIAKTVHTNGHPLSAVKANTSETTVSEVIATFSEGGEKLQRMLIEAYGEKIGKLLMAEDGEVLIDNEWVRVSSGQLGLSNLANMNKPEEKWRFLMLTCLRQKSKLLTIPEAGEYWYLPKSKTTIQEMQLVCNLYDITLKEVEGDVLLLSDVNIIAAELVETTGQQLLVDLSEEIKPSENIVVLEYEGIHSPLLQVEETYTLLKILSAALGSHNEHVYLQLTGDENNFSMTVDGDVMYEFSPSAVYRNGQLVQNMLVQEVNLVEINEEQSDNSQKKKKEYRERVDKNGIHLLNGFAAVLWQVWLALPELTEESGVLAVGTWESKKVFPILPIDNEELAGAETSGMRVYYNRTVAQSYYLNHKGTSLLNLHKIRIGEFLSIETPSLKKTKSQYELAATVLQEFNLFWSDKSSVWMDGRLVAVRIKDLPVSEQETIVRKLVKEASGKEDLLEGIIELFLIPARMQHFSFTNVSKKEAEAKARQEFEEMKEELELLLPELLDKLKELLAVKRAVKKIAARLQLRRPTAAGKLVGGVQSAFNEFALIVNSAVMAEIYGCDEEIEEAEYDIAHTDKCVIGENIPSCAGTMINFRAPKTALISSKLYDSFEHHTNVVILEKGGNLAKESKTLANGKVVVSFKNQAQFVQVNAYSDQPTIVKSYAGYTPEGFNPAIPITGIQVKKGETILRIPYQINGDTYYNVIIADDNLMVVGYDYHVTHNGIAINVDCLYPNNAWKFRGSMKAMPAPAITGKDYLYNSLNTGLPEDIQAVITKDCLKHKQLLEGALNYIMATAVRSPNGIELIAKLNQQFGVDLKAGGVYDILGNIYGLYDELKQWFVNRFGQSVWVYRRDIIQGAWLVIEKAMEVRPEDWTVYESPEILVANGIVKEGQFPENCRVYTNGDVINEETDIFVYYEDDKEPKAPLCVWQRSYVFAGIINESGEAEHVYYEAKVEISDFKTNCASSSTMGAVPNYISMNNGITPACPELANLLCSSQQAKISKYAVQMGLSLGNCELSTEDGSLPILQALSKGKMSEEFINYLLLENAERTEIVKSWFANNYIPMETLGIVFRDVILAFGDVKFYLPIMVEQDAKGNSLDSANGLTRDLIKDFLISRSEIDIAGKLRRVGALLRKMLGLDGYIAEDGLGIARQMTMAERSVQMKTVGIEGLPIGIFVPWSEVPNSAAQVYLKAVKAAGYTKEECLNADPWNPKKEDPRVEVFRTPLSCATVVPVYWVKPNTYTICNKDLYWLLANFEEPGEEGFVGPGNLWIAFHNTIVILGDMGDCDGDGRNFVPIPKSITTEILPSTTWEDYCRSVKLATNQLAWETDSYLVDHMLSGKFTKKAWLKNITSKDLILIANKITITKGKGIELKTDRNSLAGLALHGGQVKVQLVALSYLIQLFGINAINVSCALHGEMQKYGKDSQMPEWQINTGLIKPLIEVYEGAPLAGLNFDVIDFMAVLKSAIEGNNLEDLTNEDGDVQEDCDTFVAYKGAIARAGVNSTYAKEYLDVCYSFHNITTKYTKPQSQTEEEKTTGNERSQEYSIADILKMRLSAAEFGQAAAVLMYWGSKGALHFDADKAKLYLAVLYYNTIKAFPPKLVAKLEQASPIIKWLNMAIPTLLLVEKYEERKAVQKSLKLGNSLLLQRLKEIAEVEIETEELETEEVATTIVEKSTNTLSPGQQEALERMARGINKGVDLIYLTGNAGTGKSFVMKEFLNQAEEVLDKDWTILPCAPMGAAAQIAGKAINKEGSTLQKVFRILNRAVLPSDCTYLEWMENRFPVGEVANEVGKGFQKQFGALSELNLLVYIEEIMAASAEDLHAVRLVLEYLRLYEGLTYCIVGVGHVMQELTDMRTPIILNGEEIGANFRSPAFKPARYQMSAEEVVEVPGVFVNEEDWAVDMIALTENQRQSNSEFGDLLNSWTEGKLIGAELASMVKVVRYNGQVDYTDHIKNGRLVITTALSQERLINQMSHGTTKYSIKVGVPATYTNGVLVKELINSLPVPSEVRFSVGDKVLIRSNGPDYANGNKGIVLALGIDTIVVALSTNTVVEIGYVASKEVPVHEGTPVFSLMYLPVQPMLGITTAKTQGLTIGDEYVISIDAGAESVKPHAIYVALSRACDASQVTIEIANIGKAIHNAVTKGGDWNEATTDAEILNKVLSYDSDALQFHNSILEGVEEPTPRIKVRNGYLALADILEEVNLTIEDFESNIQELKVVEGNNKEEFFTNENETPSKNKTTPINTEWGFEFNEFLTKTTTTTKGVKEEEEEIEVETTSVTDKANDFFGTTTKGVKEEEEEIKVETTSVTDKADDFFGTTTTTKGVKEMKEEVKEEEIEVEPTSVTDKADDFFGTTTTTKGVKEMKEEVKEEEIEVEPTSVTDKADDFFGTTTTKGVKEMKEEVKEEEIEVEPTSVTDKADDFFGTTTKGVKEMKEEVKEEEEEYNFDDNSETVRLEGNGEGRLNLNIGQLITTNDPIEPATLYFDGGSRGNPGKAAGAAVIVMADGTTHKVSKSLEFATNNEAEYTALIIGLEKAKALGIEKLVIKGDSKLVVNQVNGTWKVNSDHLRALCNEVCNLIKDFQDTQIEWIPREQNKLADAAANECMDNATSVSEPVKVYCNFPQIRGMIRDNVPKDSIVFCDKKQAEVKLFTEPDVIQFVEKMNNQPKAEAEAAKRKAEAEAAKRKAEAEAAKRKAEAEAAKRKAEAEAAKRKAEAEAAKRKAEAEAAKRKAEAEAAKRKAEAEAAKRKAETEAAKRKAEAEAAKRKAEAEAAKRKAEAAKRKAETEEEEEMEIPQTEVLKDDKAFFYQIDKIEKELEELEKEEARIAAKKAKLQTELKEAKERQEAHKKALKAQKEATDEIEKLKAQLAAAQVRKAKADKLVEETKIKPEDEPPASPTTPSPSPKPNKPSGGGDKAGGSSHGGSSRDDSSRGGNSNNTDHSTGNNNTSSGNTNSVINNTEVEKGASPSSIVNNTKVEKGASPNSPTTITVSSVVRAAAAKALNPEKALALATKVIADGHKVHTPDMKIALNKGALYKVLEHKGVWINTNNDLTIIKDFVDWTRKVRIQTETVEGKTFYVVVSNIKGSTPGEYIGRTSGKVKGSPLGNPFRLTSESLRDTVVNKFAQHLETNPNNKMSAEIERLYGILISKGVVVLNCWCAPKACHGDVIAKRLLQKLTVKDSTPVIEQSKEKEDLFIIYDEYGDVIGFTFRGQRYSREQVTSDDDGTLIIVDEAKELVLMFVDNMLKEEEHIKEQIDINKSEGASMIIAETHDVDVMVGHLTSDYSKVSIDHKNKVVTWRSGTYSCSLEKVIASSVKDGEKYLIVEYPGVGTLGLYQENYAAVKDCDTILQLPSNEDDSSTTTTTTNTTNTITTTPEDKEITVDEIIKSGNYKLLLEGSWFEKNGQGYHVVDYYEQIGREVFPKPDAEKVKKAFKVFKASYFVAMENHCKEMKKCSIDTTVENNCIEEILYDIFNTDDIELIKAQWIISLYTGEILNWVGEYVLEEIGIPDFKCTPHVFVNKYGGDTQASGVSKSFNMIEENELISKREVLNYEQFNTLYPKWIEKVLIPSQHLKREDKEAPIVLTLAYAICDLEFNDDNDNDNNSSISPTPRPNNGGNVNSVDANSNTDGGSAIYNTGSSSISRGSINSCAAVEGGASPRSMVYNDVTSEVVDVICLTLKPAEVRAMARKVIANGHKIYILNMEYAQGKGEEQKVIDNDGVWINPNNDLTIIEDYVDWTLDKKEEALLLDAAEVWKGLQGTSKEFEQAQTIARITELLEDEDLSLNSLASNKKLYSAEVVEFVLNYIVEYQEEYSKLDPDMKEILEEVLNFEQIIKSDWILIRLLDYFSKPRDIITDKLENEKKETTYYEFEQELFGLLPDIDTTTDDNLYYNWEEESTSNISKIKEAAAHTHNYKEVIYLAQRTELSGHDVYLVTLKEVIEKGKLEKALVNGGFWLNANGDMIIVKDELKEEEEVKEVKKVEEQKLTRREINYAKDKVTLEVFNYQIANVSHFDTFRLQGETLTIATWVRSKNFKHFQKSMNDVYIGPVHRGGSQKIAKYLKQPYYRSFERNTSTEDAEWYMAEIWKGLQGTSKDFNQASTIAAITKLLNQLLETKHLSLSSFASEKDWYSAGVIANIIRSIVEYQEEYSKLDPDMKEILEEVLNFEQIVKSDWILIRLLEYFSEEREIASPKLDELEDKWFYLDWEQETHIILPDEVANLDTISNNNRYYNWEENSVKVETKITYGGQEITTEVKEAALHTTSSVRALELVKKTLINGRKVYPVTSEEVIQKDKVKKAIVNGGFWLNANGDMMIVKDFEVIAKEVDNYSTVVENDTSRNILPYSDITSEVADAIFLALKPVEVEAMAKKVIANGHKIYILNMAYAQKIGQEQKVIDNDGAWISPENDLIIIEDYVVWIL
jgi:ribonuclease HI